MPWFLSRAVLGIFQKFVLVAVAADINTWSGGILADVNPLYLKEGEK